jgi:hypothetical protein
MSELFHGLTKAFYFNSTLEFGRGGGSINGNLCNLFKTGADNYESLYGVVL